MEIIHHRRNTRALLDQTSSRHGVEIDVRSHREDLILHHDPFAHGEFFASWLQGYHHGTLILNVKEEGLEHRILDQMIEAQITNFFFLDQSFPFLRRTTQNGESRCAVRVSEYESVDTAMALERKADWVWLDSFTGALPETADLERLSHSEYRVCLVSPELQGRDLRREQPTLRAKLADAGVVLDAVCTKVPDAWS